MGEDENGGGPLAASHLSDRVRRTKIRVAGTVQAIGITALCLLEVVALTEGMDGALLLPVAGLIAGLVGLKAREVWDALAP